MLLLFIVIAAVGILAVTARFVFEENRRVQVIDRRLGAVRAWAASVYGEPVRRRAKPAVSGRSVYLLASGLFNVAATFVMVGAAERAKLRQLIIRAGFRHSDALSIFMTVKLAASLAIGLFLGFQVAEWLAEATEYSSLVAVVVGLVGFLIGGIVPEMGLRYVANRRHIKMTTALPDALDLMTLCLESGLTFERSLGRVAEELKPLSPEMARELILTEAELRLGAERKGALQALYERTEIDGLRDMATTIVQGERYGTPLAQSMKNIAINEREQRAMRIAAQVERLPVLMSLPMLLLVTPGTILLVAGPAFLLAFSALSGLGG